MEPEDILHVHKSLRQSLFKTKLIHSTYLHYISFRTISIFSHLCLGSSKRSFLSRLFSNQNSVCISHSSKSPVLKHPISSSPNVGDLILCMSFLTWSSILSQHFIKTPVFIHYSLLCYLLAVDFPLIHSCGILLYKTQLLSSVCDMTMSTLSYVV